METTRELSIDVIILVGGYLQKYPDDALRLSYLYSDLKHA